MRKRLLSALLSLTMVLTLLPVSAFGSVWPSVEGMRDGVYEWYYTQLDARQRDMYDYLKSAFGPLENGAVTVDGSKIRHQLSDEMRKITDKSNTSSEDMIQWLYDFYLAYRALEWDHPEWPWLANIGFGLRSSSLADAPGPGAEKKNGWLVWKENTWFIVTVAVSQAAIRVGEFNSEIEDAVNAINAEIGGNEMDDSELVKVIHDYLCRLVRYYPNDDAFGDETAFGALLGYQTSGPVSYENTAFSGGYAAAFKLLCDRFGIPCVRVAGDLGQMGGETNHGWNLVQLDGQWYGVDCAADDDDIGGVISHDYFAVGSNTLVNGAPFGSIRNVANEQTIWGDREFLLPLNIVPGIDAAAYEEGGTPPVRVSAAVRVDCSTVTYGDPLTVTADLVEKSDGSPALGTVTVENEAGVELARQRVEDGMAVLVYDTGGKGLRIGANTLTVNYIDDAVGSRPVQLASGTVTLEQRLLDAEIRNVSKDYDGTDRFTNAALTLTNLVGGDDVTAIGSGTTDDSEAGNWGVQCLDATLDGGDQGYYSLVPETVQGSLTINRIAPEITITAQPAAQFTGRNVTLTVAISNPKDAVGGFPTTEQILVTASNGAVAELVQEEPGIYTAVCTLPDTAGTVTFSANVSAGAANYTPAAAAATCTVTAQEKNAATVLLGASSTAVTYGGGVTLIATVSGTTPAPTGRVQFKMGDEAVGSPVTVSSGKATLDLTQRVLQASETPYVFTAVFTPNSGSDYRESTSGPVAVTVNKKVLSTAGFRWNTAGSPFTYDGTEKGIVPGGSYPEELKMTASGRTATDAGSYTATAAFKLKDGLAGSNYDTTGAQAVTADWTILPARLKGRDANKNINYSNTQVQTVSAGDFGITQSGTFARRGDVTDSGSVLAAEYPACGSDVKFKLAEGVDFQGQTVTIPLTFTPKDKNFAPVDVTLTVTLTDKTAPTLTASSFTRAYNGRAVKADEITKTASTAGTWAFKETAPVNVADSGTYTLVFTPADGEQYIAAEIPVSITISKAKPNGTPAYSAITSANKTLADAKLRMGSLAPSGGTVRWIDGDGSELPNSTKVAANTSYTWQYTPSDSGNFDAVTGTVVLYRTGSSGSGSGGNGGYNPGSSGGGSGNTTTPSTGGSGSSGNTAAPTTGPVVRPPTSVQNDVLTGSMSAADGEQLLKAAAGGSEKLVMTTETTAPATPINKVVASIPASVLSSLGHDTNAGLTVSTPLGSVFLPNDALAALGGSTGTVTVTISRNADQSKTVTVAQDGHAVGSLPSGMRASLYVKNDLLQKVNNLVAVQVNADGTESILPKCYLKSATTGHMDVLLDGGNTTVKFVDNGKAFHDMNGHWASSAVDFVTSRNLFLGVTSSSFAPEWPMTRAMMVTVLHRLESEPSAGQRSFSDVSPDSYYAEATAWAMDLGITNGDDSGGFNGEENISREMLVTMLYRYAQRIAGGKGATASYSSMGGSNDVHDWAEEAMRWAVGSGIITGDTNGNLNPRNYATRGEVAVMLERFVGLLLK